MNTGQVMLITGASSGIGAATARLFASRGYRVVLAARRLERLKEIENEIIKAGGEAISIETDLNQLDQIQALVDKTIKAYGQLDILFNNAGFGRGIWTYPFSRTKTFGRCDVDNTSGTRSFQFR